MRKLYLALGLISLLFTIACGSGTSTSGTPGPTPQGNYTNASLSGQYFYQLKGTNLTNGFAFSEAGVFTADGNGNITSGSDDYNEIDGSGISHDTITGTYTVRNDGISVATLNFGTGGSIAIGFTLLGSSRVYLTEDDTFATGAGSAVKQDPTAFSAAPNGTFTFRTHTASTLLGSTSSVGLMNIVTGAGTGNEDILRSGITSSLTLTSTFFAPDTTGRGTGSFTDSTLATSNFVYYVLDANNLRILISDIGVVGSGSAVVQTGSPFGLASLSGNYAFGTKGDTSLFIDGIGTVGRFTADGAGNISAGVLDGARDGVTTTNTTFTGTYTAAANGRLDVTLAPSTGGTIHEILWMISPTRAFLLVDDPTKVEDGNVDTQQAITYSNSTLTGQFAFVMHGFTTTPNTYERVGTLRPDGAGNMALAYFLNVSGSVSPTPINLTGTYTIGSNGRGTGIVSSLSNNLVFYLISPSDGYILQNDTGVEINGNMSKQQ
jgi:hypothetical protein